ncbi:MAG: hypothetical protein OEX81_01420 [Candidatus Pacebacteria bacterium]|nr:hypothetical protein [Candidatus Paceibacterota bacterium]
MCVIANWLKKLTTQKAEEPPKPSTTPRGKTVGEMLDETQQDLIDTIGEANSLRDKLKKQLDED